MEELDVPLLSENLKPQIFITMKRTLSAALLLFTFILAGCEGSDVYQGTWKALDKEGNKIEIMFSPTEMSIENGDKQAEKWGYTQNSVNINNGVRNYGIKVDNGKTYSIIFPIANDTEKGAVADQNGNILYIIGKKKYYTYDDIYGL